MTTTAPTTGPARFSAQEMERRAELARELMDRSELDALVLYGSGGSTANIRWLCGHEELVVGYLVMPREGEPLLLVSYLNHLPNARELSTVRAEWGGFHPAEAVAEHLRACGARRAGLVGVDSAFELGMPYAHHDRLRAGAPGVELVDATAAFEALPIVKSEEEIELLRHAARLTDDGFAALVAAARPGVAEYELVAACEHAYRRQGGELGISFIRTMPMDAPTGCVPAQRASARRLERGDVIVTELSAGWEGYSGQVLWPIFVGADPTPEWQRMFDAALETLHALERAVRHGATIADAVAAAEPIRRIDHTIYDDLLHGLGIGLHPPFLGPDEFERPPADGGMRFERGMPVVLQPNPITRDERTGIQLGGLAIVRDDGVERLQNLPGAPIVVG